MLAVVEDYKSIVDQEDKASTCLSHVQHRGAADQVLKEAARLSFDFRIENYNYRLVEFKEECPNCGRSFEF